MSIIEEKLTTVTYKCENKENNTLLKENEQLKMVLANLNEENKQCKIIISELESKIRKLESHNSSLVQESKELKEEISDLQSIKVSEIHQSIPTVSTQNRFAMLDPENNDLISNINNTESPKNSNPSKWPNSPGRDVEIVMDSHGNELKVSKLYRNKNVKLTVLGGGKKNI